MKICFWSYRVLFSPLVIMFEYKIIVFLENVKNLDHHEEKDKITFSPTL